MNSLPEKAYSLLRAWKGDAYVFGMGVLDQVGALTAKYGKRATVVSNTTYLKPVADRVVASLEAAGVTLVCGIVPDAKPNAPREDVYRLETYILHHRPEVIVAVGGGSTIDACKAAIALACLGAKATPEIDPYFGTGEVTKAMEATGTALLPMIAVETSASSGAHLTKYSNVTDPVAGQKKLIVDPAIVPPAALFDYETTYSMPLSVTTDGALDAIAHTFEVFCGATKETYDQACEIAKVAIELVVENTKRLLDNPHDPQAREAIGLATDLGGYAIMIGGTSGAHMTSFSLVDIAAHGTACGLMNPYYAVFYSRAIQPQLRVVGDIFRRHGYIDQDLDALSGVELARAVAGGMQAFNRAVGAPATLRDLKGFTEEHIERALASAKDPQLEMKLRNMPVPMTSADVDEYMRPILMAAASGDLSLIKEM